MPDQLTSGREITPRTAVAVDDGLLGDLRLQCPRCTGQMNGFDCGSCGFHLHNDSGIWEALTPERAVLFEKFIEDYEFIRKTEARGSEDDDFYLGLPYKDVSGRQSKNWRIRARSFDHLMKHVLQPLQNGARILDIGAGNCWMSFRLALAGFQPVAVDLLTNDTDGLGAATHYQKHLRQFFSRFRAEAARLPFGDGQFDAVVFNASFHYSENYIATLREALRCTRVGGLVVISDTPWYSCESSGERMVFERQAAFLQKYGTASNSIRSLEYLTDDRLRFAEEQLAIQWATHTPNYGFKWAMRPLLAKLQNRREPSRFRIYVARKDTR